METPEEPQQAFEFQTSFRDIPYDRLPPYLQKAVDDALASLGENTPFGEAQMFTSVNRIISDYGSPSRPQPQFWAKWDYSEEEWRLFDQLDWGRARNRLITTAVLVALVCFLFFSLIFLGFVSAPDSASSVPFLAIIFSLTLLGLTFLLTFAITGRPFWEARKRHQARRTGPHRLTIGSLSTFNDQGLWEAGTFFPLQETFLSLRSVKMTEHPPVLHLRRKHVEIRQSSWHDTLRVFVPRGHEAEARQLVERFKAETIGSRKRSYTPAEPSA